MIAAFLLSLFIMSSRIQMASATVTIEADGSINPPGASISSVDNTTYILTADIEDSLVVERDNIIIDGDGYTLYGKGTFSTGIDLYETNNVTIRDIEIKAFWTGIEASLSSNLKIHGNNISNCKTFGISLTSSQNNSIFGNNLTANRNGIHLLWASDNTIIGNNITDQQYGRAIGIFSSRNNTFTTNLINNYGYALQVDGSTLGEFLHSIDSSNLIDGKPVFYLVNQTNLIVDTVTYPEIGYLGLINSFNLTVEGLTLTNNGQGLLLAYTNNSGIADNNVTGNEYGVELHSSFNNKIFRNNITLNEYSGIRLTLSSSNNTFFNNRVTESASGIIFDESSNNNTVSRNFIANNSYGIQLHESLNNTVIRNIIFGNDVGIFLEATLPYPNNQFYHNNFLDNSQNVEVYTTGSYVSGHNVWDNGFEGNYWNNYTGLDLDLNGIGDPPHSIDANNTDHYPLMGMFQSFNTSLSKYVNAISNSTIEDFEYFEPNSTIRMYVSNITGNQTHGFVRISIPHTLLSEPYNITIDGANPTYWNYTLFDNGTHRWIYFEFQHSTLEIVIIPEFPSLIVLPLSMAITLLAAIIYSKHRSARLCKKITRIKRTLE